MIRQAPRHIFRNNASILRHIPPRRLLSTAPPHQRSRSWKSATTRWGLAIGLIYFYNTSNLFAEEAAYPISQPLSPSEETTLPTLDDVARSHQKAPKSPQSSSSQPPPPPSDSSTSAAPSLDETEEEAHAEGAFNEETGEINWDCPCLGGMAHGPCGPQFREAFSCFVYSTDEPKGIDCIDRFKGMQDCFREHPEVYGEELEGAEEDEEVQADAAEGGTAGPLGEIKEGAGLSVARDDGLGGEEQKIEGGPLSSAAASAQQENNKTEESAVTATAKAAKEQVEKEHGRPRSESDAVVPKAAHDAR